MDAVFGGEGVMKLSSMLDESRVAAEKSSGLQDAQPPMNTAPLKVVTNAQKRAQEDNKPKKGDIWSGDEIPTEDFVLGITKDDRPAPKYEFSYKQKVGTQDTFLGMSGLTPGSMDCSHLVVKIHFPGAKMKDLDLDVTRNRIKAESPRHRLFTYLPCAVRHESGSAQFDTSKEVLTITLPIINELFEDS